MNKICDEYKNNKVQVSIKHDKIVRITKIIDHEFNGNHPNGINTGFIKQGVEVEPPQIGERYYVGLNFSTSPVTKITKGTIKTTYSTYKLEYINE